MTMRASDWLDRDMRPVPSGNGPQGHTSEPGRPDTATSPKTEPLDGIQVVAGSAPPSDPAMTGVIRLAALGGPHEAAELAGIPQRSIHYYTHAHGFPRPVKQLRGIRLWNLEAVTAWKDARGNA